ncbi:uncharacterized protein LOC123318066 [Coccinella septempunctata]|uniref:uncharacterized protein LOC123318066 n=1 Tax=Coccinella septempunctata TaxID=41139 RepID=UPI001D05F739|nr:uncharacterized protein LOC123318066 [Coccinella septempunctata]
MGVPFLDTRVIRNTDGDLRLDWYRKPTHSGRYLHYYSNHPHRQKINMILGLKNRIQRISHQTFHQKNLKLLFNSMLNNGYPKGLLTRLLYNSAPPGQPMSGVVYRVPCSTCEEVYIGQTSQTVKRRITQHISDIKNPDKTCALAEHVRRKDHRMDYGAVEVLDFENNTRKRCFLEMFHIKSHNNSMNYRRDIEGISNIYSYLINLKEPHRPPTMSSVLLGADAVT